MSSHLDPDEIRRVEAPPQQTPKEETHRNGFADRQNVSRLWNELTTSLKRCHRINILGQGKYQQFMKYPGYRGEIVQDDQTLSSLLLTSQRNPQTVLFLDMDGLVNLICKPFYSCVSAHLGAKHSGLAYCILRTYDTSLRAAFAV